MSLRTPTDIATLAQANLSGDVNSGCSEVAAVQATVRADTVESFSRFAKKLSFSFKSAHSDFSYQPVGAFTLKVQQMSLTDKMPSYILYRTKHRTSWGFILRKIVT